MTWPCASSGIENPDAILPIKEIDMPTWMKSMAMHAYDETGEKESP
jgi:hypothetical protein